MNIKANQQQQQQHNETKQKKTNQNYEKPGLKLFLKKNNKKKISKFTRQSNVIHLLNTCVNISLISHTYKNLNKYKIK